MTDSAQIAKTIVAATAPSPEEKTQKVREEKARADIRIGLFYVFFFLCLFLICCYGLIAES